MQGIAKIEPTPQERAEKIKAADLNRTLVVAELHSKLSSIGFEPALPVTKHAAHEGEYPLHYTTGRLRETNNLCRLVAKRPTFSESRHGTRGSHTPSRSNMVRRCWMS